MRAALTVFAAAALALPWTGCHPMLFLRDAACHGYDAGDPLLEARFGLLEEPFREGEVQDTAKTLYLLVGTGGKAAMVYEPKNRELLRSRCRPLAPDDLAAVTQAVERLERSVVTERAVRRPSCHEWTHIVLRGDHLLRTFDYCDTTPPAPVIRFVGEISAPLGRQFGKELAAGLAATASWAPPVLLEPPG